MGSRVCAVGILLLAGCSHPYHVEEVSKEVSALIKNTTCAGPAIFLGAGEGDSDNVYLGFRVSTSAGLNGGTPDTKEMELLFRADSKGEWHIDVEYARRVIASSCTVRP